MAVLQLTKDNFDEEVLGSEQIVLIDFWASWCAPCKMLSPTIEIIAEDYPQVKVCKVNVDQEPELAGAFNVSSIPMLVVIKDKKIVDTSAGVVPKEKIVEMLDKN
ncbi:MAG: thioredoxin [Clostridia bacterium]|nr:thioredoxin [Clostridia bacterium]MDE7328468.1 thioredoxin [Clostridia bacterium]